MLFYISEQSADFSVFVHVDLFGGREDLQKKILRCVGEPEQRFQEDALRMLRALRFVAKLGFAIEEKTKLAIEKCAPFAEELAPERVCAELEQILLSGGTETAVWAFRWGLMDAYAKGNADIPDWRARATLAHPLPRNASVCILR